MAPRRGARALPAVSVVMSTYNHGRYLHAAIASMLQQTFKDFEFIIVDDASTDATEQILDGFSDARVVRLRNEKNLGLAASLNRGIGIASGKYVARMDSDDVSCPDRLQRQIDHMEAHPEIEVLGTQFRKITTTGKVTAESSHPLTHGLITWHYVSRLAYPLTHATIMMRTRFLEKNGGYNESYRREQDGELFLRSIDVARYANLPNSLHLAGRGSLTRDSASIFDKSYSTTLELRRQCLCRLLRRDVGPDEVRALVYPTSRSHRQRLRIGCSTEEALGGIALLQEIWNALSTQGHFDAAERDAAQAEIGALSASLLRYCDDYVFDACDRISIVGITRYLSRRLGRKFVSLVNSLDKS